MQLGSHWRQAPLLDHREIGHSFRTANVWEAAMAAWVKCTDNRGQIVHVNLDNATTLSRDDVRLQGTEVVFIGGGVAVVRETPEQILKAPRL